ncbi:MAG TPA: hypothetical protein PLC40_20280, partial [Candidatus Hydrogenedentes bacterium]|nr:hypothetical protein [Candidatus Hydrogenedentota bacterium]
GAISCKQLHNRVVVTYQNVRLSNIITEQTASFQVEMFFDGRIVITWLRLDTYIGLIGLSRGGGVPEGFMPSRFTGYAGCPSGIFEEYSIRVNFSPPEVLPYHPRWRTGTSGWLSDGAYTSVPLGNNEVEFNYVPIYWTTPEPIMTSSDTPDDIVVLNPVWIRAKGTVHVSTVPETAGWTLFDAEGSTYPGTGNATLTDIPTGTATIEWHPLEGYSQPTPAVQRIVLYPDSQITFSGFYPVIGEEGEGEGEGESGEVGDAGSFYASGGALGDLTAYSGVIAIDTGELRGAPGTLTFDGYTYKARTDVRPDTFLEVAVFEFDHVFVSKEVTVSVTGNRPLSIAARGDMDWAADIAVPPGKL